jgi:hypothetical protein
VGALHGSDIPGLTSFKPPPHLLKLLLIEFYSSPNPFLNTTSPSFQGTDYLLNFVNNLDPNVFNHPDAESLSKTIYWPPYDETNRNMLFFLDGTDDNNRPALAIGKDDFREEPIEYLLGLTRGSQAV